MFVLARDIQYRVDSDTAIVLPGFLYQLGINSSFYCVFETDGRKRGCLGSPLHEGIDVMKPMSQLLPDMRVRCVVKGCRHVSGMAGTTSQVPWIANIVPRQIVVNLQNTF